MPNINREERLQIMLTPEELKALDDWRFTRRMPSRASAVRELLRHGLAAQGTVISLAGAKSKDYGVVSPAKASPKKARVGSINGQSGNGSA
jgi:hypothetical protein